MDITRALKTNWERKDKQRKLKKGIKDKGKNHKLARYAKECRRRL